MFLGLRKLGNICCGHKMFLNKIRNIFVSRTQNLCPQQMLRTRANGETFVSATMCPQLCVLVCQGLKRDFSRFLAQVSAKCLSIQKLNLGKICLKAVVKVAVSLQRPASARQVKISNHTMIVPSQLPTKKKLPSCTLNK